MVCCSANTIRPMALLQSGGKLIALRVNTYTHGDSRRQHMPERRTHNRGVEFALRGTGRRRRRRRAGLGVARCGHGSRRGAARARPPQLGVHAGLLQHMLEDALQGLKQTAQRHAVAVLRMWADGWPTTQRRGHLVAPCPACGRRRADRFPHTF